MTTETNIDARQPPEPTEPAEAVFQRFDAYDFDQDAEYQAGLAPILQSASGSLSDEMALLAKAFYYYQKIEPFDLQDYKAWKDPVRPLTDEDVDAALRKQAQDASLFNYDSISIGPRDESVSQGVSANTDAELPYPASFAEIVALIKSGKPVPGIQHIPDKLAEEPESVSVIEPKKKPWQEDSGAPAPSIFDSVPQESDEMHSIA